MSSIYDCLFTKTLIECPKCKELNVSRVNGLLICLCGWYHVKKALKIIKLDKVVKNKKVVFKAPKKRRAIRVNGGWISE